LTGTRDAASRTSLSASAAVPLTDLKHEPVAVRHDSAGVSATKHLNGRITTRLRWGLAMAACIDVE
jgi:hypothetical protein